MDTDVVFLPPVTQPRAPPLPRASCAPGPKPHASCPRPAAPPPLFGTRLLGQGPRGLPGGGCRGPPEDTRLGVPGPPQGPILSPGTVLPQRRWQGAREEEGDTVLRDRASGPGPTSCRPAFRIPGGNAHSTPGSGTVRDALHAYPRECGVPCPSPRGLRAAGSPGKICLPILSWIPDGS